MKIFIVILSLITPLWAQELKPQVSQKAINRAWMKVSSHTGLAQLLYRNYNKSKNKRDKVALDATLAKLDLAFKQLVEIKQLRHVEIKVSLDKLSKEKQTQYRNLVSNLTEKYGHGLALEMMDMGTEHVLKHGFKMPDNLTLNTHLPELESKQLEAFFNVSEEKMPKIKPEEFKLTKTSPQHLLWLKAASDLQNYVEMIQMMAKNGNADPAQIMLLVDNYEKVIQLMVDAKILETKTYPQSFQSLPMKTRVKIANYLPNLVPEFGVNLPREMLGDSLVDMVKTLDPKYNKNQFKIYLPKPHFKKVVEMIDIDLKEPADQ